MPTTNAAVTPIWAVIGGGVMGSAVVHGALAAGVLDPARVIVADPDAARRARFTRAVARAAEAVALAAPGPVLLAVKPQSLAAVAAQLVEAGASLSGRLVVSVLAGATTVGLAATLPGSPRVVRVMPNTPASIGRGMSAIAGGPTATAADVAAVRTLFAALGEVAEIDEPLMDAFTAVAGSGPAYLFYLAEAMTIAAVRLGFDPATADAIVRQTLAGSAELLHRSRDRGAAELRAAVTSKGGTTAAATAVLDAAKLTDTVIAALRAARDRGRELSGP